MSPIERVTPPLSGTETEILVGMLDYHRATLRLKADGLDPAASSRNHCRLEHSPSAAWSSTWPWSSRAGCSHRLRGEPVIAPFDTVDWSADDDWDFHSAADDTPGEVTALRTTRRSRPRTRSCAWRSPRAGSTSSPPVPGRRSGKHFDLRWILTHLIEEYARHNGHADLLRESIDGQVGQ